MPSSRSNARLSIQEELWGRFAARIEALVEAASSAGSHDLMIVGLARTVEPNTAQHANEREMRFVLFSIFQPFRHLVAMHEMTREHVLTVCHANGTVQFDVTYFSALGGAHSPVGTLPPPVFFNVSASLLPLLAVMICP